MVFFRFQPKLLIPQWMTWFNTHSFHNFLRKSTRSPKSVIVLSASSSLLLKLAQYLSRTTPRASAKSWRRRDANGICNPVQENEWRLKTSEPRYEAVPGSACLPLSFPPLMGLSEPSGSPVVATTSSQVYIWGSERDSWVGASGCDLGVLVSATALHPCVTPSLFASGLKWNSQNCCFICSIGWETLGPPVPG